MKITEIKEMSEAELQKKFRELGEELFEAEELLPEQFVLTLFFLYDGQMKSCLLL